MKQLKAVWYLYEDGTREYVEQCQPMVTPRSMLRSFLQGLMPRPRLLPSAWHEEWASLPAPDGQDRHGELEGSPRQGSSRG
jgi:hypothetical protein